MNNPTLRKSIALLLATSTPLLVFAEQASQSINSTDDKTIVVTANRTEQKVNDTLAAVDIITRQDIDRLQPESITDLLSTIAGFDLVYNGGAGQSSSLFTRGTSSDHTLILIDGVRVGSATLGNKAFSDISVAQIERIEIVKGPRASLWGSDAIGGVIHIFTRRLDNGEYNIEASVGSNGYLSTNGSFGFGSEEIKNTVTLSFEESDGFDVFDNSTDNSPDTEPDDDGYQRISAAIRGDYALSAATNLDWVIQYDEGDSSFDNTFGADVNEYQNYFWNIRYIYTLDKLMTEFAVKQSTDEATSRDSKNPGSENSIFETQRDQVNVLAQYTFNPIVNLTGGYEYYNDDIGGSDVRQFDGTFVKYDESQRDSNAYFVSSVINYDGFVSEMSARYDDIESIGSEQTFNLSAGYRVSDNLLFSASRSKGFKAPTFNDLYFPGFGNADLVSEISYNTEFLLRANWQSHSLVISKYDNKVDQLITFVFNPTTGGFGPENIDKANLKGHEVVYNFRHGDWSHQLTASYVDAIDQSLDFNGEPKNVQLLRRAKEFYGYEVSADLGDFSFFTQVNYIGRRRDIDFNTFTDVYLDAYFAVNLGATYQVNEQLSFKAKISDAADSAEPTVANYNVAGRQFFLTVQYRNF